MLRKLTSLLFREEEIIVEEEEHEMEPVNIPALKPVQATETSVEEEKKSFRIDLEPQEQKQDPRRLVKPTIEPRREPKRESTPYVAHEIISPIHGGPNAEEKPIASTKIPAVKKRSPLTEVISPMFGKVEEPSAQASEVDLSLLEMDVESMIAPEYDQQTQEAIQTSLFDYLEKDDNSEL